MFGRRRNGLNQTPSSFFRLYCGFERGRRIYECGRLASKKRFTDSLTYPRSVKLLHDEYSFRNKEQPTCLWTAGSSLTQKHNGRRCCFCSVCDGIHRSCRSESHKSRDWIMACSSIGKSFRLITGWFRVRVPAGQSCLRNSIRWVV